MFLGESRLAETGRCPRAGQAELPGWPAQEQEKARVPGAEGGGSRASVSGFVLSFSENQRFLKARPHSLLRVQMEISSVGHSIYKAGFFVPWLSQPEATETPSRKVPQIS